MTDISPGMVARCQARFGHKSEFRFAVADGKNLSAVEQQSSFDLICSNLAAQWFEDLPAALSGLVRLLTPGGWLAVTTLCDGTFAEWRCAHAELGLEAGTPNYPSLEMLQTMRLNDVTVMIESERVLERHPTAVDFIRSLTAIGAGTPSPTHRPLSAVAMRNVMRRFDVLGTIATYHIATCPIRRTNRRGI